MTGTNLIRYDFGLQLDQSFVCFLLNVLSHSDINLFCLCSFEKELKNKLQQKSSGVTSEEQVLKKSFKYFDLNSNGTVEPDEFAKAIEKIGIMIPTKQVSRLTPKFHYHKMNNAGKMLILGIFSIFLMNPCLALKIIFN